MIARLRQAYNSAFRPATWEGHLESAAARFGAGVRDALAPTPVFLPSRLLGEMNAIAQDLFELLGGTPGLPGDEVVPPPWRMEDDSPAPHLLNIDFALTRLPGGRIAPRVLELQGFPSYYFSQLFLAELYASIAPHEVRPDAAFLGGYEAATYAALLRETILGGEAPEQVLLVDIEPEKQKNWMEFQLTARYCGIRIACVSRLERRGRRIGIEVDGGFQPIRRIYSRLVPEEVAARNLKLPWGHDDPPDVSWVVHPRWFFRWSKAVLPHLRHRAVPATTRLDDPGLRPDDIQGRVLKPLYSYGGRGVLMSPKRADLDAIPADRRCRWILMDRIAPEPLVQAPVGDARLLCEVRLLFVRRRDRFEAVSTMVRLGERVTAEGSRNGLGPWSRLSLAFAATDPTLS